MPSKTTTPRPSTDETAAGRVSDSQITAIPQPRTGQDSDVRRRCFVIGPIGRDNSDTRKRSDQILRHIIEPVVVDLGYEKPLRADLISESGRITQQIITHIIEDELVIADLTDSNANVYYELALRHAIKKPFIQLLAGDEALPFDVADQRTIMLDYKDLDSVASAKGEMSRQVLALRDGNVEIDNPLSFAVDVASLRGSEDPGDRTQGEILEMLQELRSMSKNTYSAVRHRPEVSADFTALRNFVEVTSQKGNVTDKDVLSLKDPFASTEHNRWVDIIITKMAPFMPIERQSAPAGGGWGNTNYPDDPPF